VLSLASLVLNAQSWSLSGNSGTTTSNFLGTKDSKPIIFKTNKIEQMRITQNGRIGIGTTEPSYRLTIVNTTSETPTGLFSYSVIGPGKGYGIITYGGLKGIYAEANGGNYSGTAFGVHGVAYGTAGTRYGVYGYASGGALNWAGFFAGNVTINGSLFMGSDRKLKTDINALQNSLEQLMKLKPSTYKYKATEYAQMALPDTKQMGLIADEVKQVFPELVREQVQPAEYDKDGLKVIHPEIKFEGVNYIGFIPALIASVQEQQKKILEQQKIISSIKADNETLKQNEALTKAENDVLKSRLDKIEQMLSVQQQTSISKTVLLTTGHLEQNVPNPFNQSTSIKYFLPQNVGNAIIKITNAEGQVLKTFSITSGNGEITLQAAQLKAGTYQYSLIADGKLIATRKMVVLM